MKIGIIVGVFVLEILVDEIIILFKECYEIIVMMIIIVIEDVVFKFF